MEESTNFCQSIGDDVPSSALEPSGSPSIDAAQISGEIIPARPTDDEIRSDRVSHCQIRVNRENFDGRELSITITSDEQDDIDPGDEDELAELFVETVRSCDGHPTLLFDGQEFLNWREACFENATDEDIARLLRDYLRSRQIRRSTKMARNVTRVLRTICYRNLAGQSGRSLYVREAVRKIWIALTNGCVSVHEDGSPNCLTPHPHSPSRLTRHVISVEYRPEIGCEPGRRLLNLLVGEEHAERFIELLAMLILPVNPWRWIFSLLCGSAERRTAIVNLIVKLFGNQSCTRLPVSLMVGRRPEQRLAGRHVVLAEVDADLDSATSRAVRHVLDSSGEIFSGPAWLVFVGSDLPVTNSANDPFLNQLQVVITEGSGEPPAEISDEELSSLVNCALAALPRLLQRRQLSPSQDVDDLLQQHRVEACPALQFLQERVQESPEGSVGQVDLWQACQEFLRGNGERPVGKVELNRLVRRMFPSVTVKRPGARNAIRTRAFHGITLNPA